VLVGIGGRVALVLMVGFGHGRVAFFFCLMTDSFRCLVPGACRHGKGKGSHQCTLFVDSESRPSGFGLIFASGTTVKLGGGVASSGNLVFLFAGERRSSCRRALSMVSVTELASECVVFLMFCLFSRCGVTSLPGLWQLVKIMFRGIWLSPKIWKFSKDSRGLEKPHEFLSCLKVLRQFKS
jgi:hypothetical protein